MLPPHTRDRGGKCAGPTCSSDRIDDRGVRRERARCRRQQIDPAGAKFDHNQLHDGMQLSGSDLPSHVRGAFLVIRLQRHRQRVVPEYLFEPATGLSDDLRAHFAIPVNSCR